MAQSLRCSVLQIAWKVYTFELTIGWSSQFEWKLQDQMHKEAYLQIWAPKKGDDNIRFSLITVFGTAAVCMGVKMLDSCRVCAGSAIQNRSWENDICCDHSRPLSLLKCYNPFLNETSFVLDLTKYAQAVLKSWHKEHNLYKLRWRIANVSYNGALLT